MKHIIFLLIGFFSFASVQVDAQNDCGLAFKRALDKVKSLRASSGKNGFEMNCIVTVTGKNGNVKHETMQVISKGNKYKYSSGKFDLYQDNSTMVVFQHEQKAVFITKATSEEMRVDQFSEMGVLQDSLQRHMTIAGCEREFGSVDPGEGYIKISFIPDKRIEGAGLKSVTYWMSVSTEEIKKILIEYTGDSAFGVKRYELIVKKMSTKVLTSPFDGQAVALAIKDKKIREEYKGYRLIDKRKTSR